jgi:hypothetical protein
VRGRDLRVNRIVIAGFAGLLLTAASVWGQRQDPTSLGFTKKFTIEVKNPGSVTLDNWPIVLDAAEIRESFPDFNVSSYAIFEETGREFILAVSQPDDLDRDKTFDEIVFIRTIPASTTLTFSCYYSPRGSFRLMTTPQKAAARFGWDAATSALGWESNYCAYSLLDGRVEFYGKFDPFLVLKFFKADMSPKQDWGMAVFQAGETSGLGGLNLWAGSSLVPVAGARPRTFKTENKVIAAGPLRSLVRADFSGVPGGENTYEISQTLSAYADNIFSRQDVAVGGGPGGPVVCAPGIRKIPGEAWTLDEKNGFAAAWGEGARGAGEIGLALIFRPEAFAGLEETESERFIKLRTDAASRCTYWIVGGWDKGIRSPLPPRGRNWLRQTESLAAKILAPLEIRFKKP